MLSSRLSALRKNRNLTQADQAKVLGIARTTYAMYEQGNREPDYDTLKKLADFFDVDTDYLLGRTDKPRSEVSIAYDGGYIDVEDDEEAEYLLQQQAEYRRLKERFMKEKRKDQGE
ncbi:helix-turn-helix domain-containing protein [Bacillus suaedae]|uniref:Helix-turn-helix transcriptional regulator n=1 Tax=Halalkalibacter suaedae TaxID=2822140 RepID=A0A940WXU5_9BACI|nr:helix-turn-helix transcriptional regulator [Bacillus suaedae]MBP3950301.1 helix-turn-helix transcriptional regulator [Bacillus suaedae]